MDYSFNIEFAKRYGVDEAIMVKSFQYWIRLNKANKVNYHDSRYWTFNTYKSLTEYYPFYTEKQVRRIIESLVDKKILIKGNYNKISYDRTIWYAFYNEELYLSDNFHLEDNPSDHMGNTIFPNGQMDITEWANRFPEKGAPIPITNQLLKTITNTVSKENCKFSETKLNPFEIVSQITIEKEKEKLREKKKKNPDEQKVNKTYEAFSIFCHTFEEVSGVAYPTDHNGHYIMTSKDAGSMVYLMRFIDKVDRNDNWKHALKVFVSAAWNLNDKWLRNNFTPAIIYSQSSKIFTAYQTSSPEAKERRSDERLRQLTEEYMAKMANEK